MHQLWGRHEAWTTDQTLRSAVRTRWGIARFDPYEKVLDCVGDASRIRQVIDNLLANVRAHTPTGTSTEVKLNRIGDTATIIVADTGPGMTEDQAKRIFERFYRIDPSRSRRSGGAGLGLSIVQAVVGAHHGRIEVQSLPGSGTSFVIDLPTTLSCSSADVRDDGPTAHSG